ncbi:hypothetical protein PYK22_00023 [Pyrinomonas methylaliphatogenes]|uniref:Uncharacterized protein n=1 Tax=Pyrinomonas methylaliphatogenes TaxID=454194 RepID=A0A0B6WSP8_9BACT|nr:hypothetical protein PYK22_00023 [Pyrinomonas methylaliphatogenes]
MPRARPSSNLGICGPPPLSGVNRCAHPATDEESQRFVGIHCLASHTEHLKSPTFLIDSLGINAPTIPIKLWDLLNFGTYRVDIGRGFDYIYSPVLENSFQFHFQIKRDDLKLHAILRR